jgi:hypothetical protein
MRGSHLHTLRGESAAASWWDPRYIPISDQDGDGYCVDSASPAGPVVMHNHAMGIDWMSEAGSLAEFLEDLAARFESGRYVKEHGSLWPNHPELCRSYMLESASCSGLQALASRLGQRDAWQLHASSDELRLRAGLLRAHIYPREGHFELSVHGFADLDEAARFTVAISEAADGNVRLQPRRE